MKRVSLQVEIAELRQALRTGMPGIDKKEHIYCMGSPDVGLLDVLLCDEIIMAAIK